MSNLTEGEKLLYSKLEDDLLKINDDLCDLSTKKARLHSKRFEIQTKLIKMDYGIDEGTEIIIGKEQFKIVAFDRGYIYGVSIIGNKLKKDGTYGTGRRVLRLYNGFKLVK